MLFITCTEQHSTSLMCELDVRRTSLTCELDVRVIGHLFDACLCDFILIIQQLNNTFSRHLMIAINTHF